MCGRVIEYRPVGLHYRSRGIEGNYVYGVSLTHGQNPRKHIWTFVGASDEKYTEPYF